MAKGGGIQAAGLICSRALRFLFASVAVRVLGPAGYGLYRQATQIFTIGTTLGASGLHLGALRFVAVAIANEEKGTLRRTVGLSVRLALASSLIVSISLVLFADHLAGAFVSGSEDRDSLALLLRVGAAYIPLSALMLVLAYATLGFKNVAPAVMVTDIIQPGMRFAAGVPLLLAGFAVMGAVVTLVASVAVALIAAIYLFFRVVPADDPRVAPSLKLGQLLRFSLPEGGAALLAPQAIGLGIIVLGIRSTNEEVGLFVVALALQVPGLVSQATVQTIWPSMVAHLHEANETARMESLFQTITRWLATLSFPALTLVMIQPDLLARLFGGERAADAAPVAAILAAGNLFFVGTGPGHQVLGMIGKPQVNFANSLGSLLVYGTAGFFVVPRYGAIGMAVVDSAVTMLVNLIRVGEGKILAGIQPFGKSFMKPVVSTAAAAAALLIWMAVLPEDLKFDVIGLALYGLVYLLVLRAFGMDPEERLVWTAIRSRIPFGRPKS